jgi:HEPN domain-containing protein
MPSKDAKINDYITRSFRDVADEDYIAARALYRGSLDLQFLWSALQTIEKYLKSILLYHRATTKGLGHDLSTTLGRVRGVTDASFEIPSDVTRFIERLGAQGINRYFERPINTDGLGLLELDKAVWHLRRYCRPVRADAKVPISGRLEQILDSPSDARRALVWKNLYFGRYKEIKFSRRIKWANPSNFIFPEIFPDLDKIIKFSKPVRDHFLRLLKRNNDAVPHQERRRLQR